MYMEHTYENIRLMQIGTHPYSRHSAVLVPCLYFTDAVKSLLDRQFVKMGPFLIFPLQV